MRLRALWIGGVALALAACGGEAEAPAPAASVSPNARSDIAELLRADRAAVRHASDGGGRAWLARDAAAPPLRAGEPARFAFGYEAGPLGIALGGRLFLQVPPNWGWSPPQTADAAGPGYTELATDAAGVRLEPEVVDEGLLAIAIAGRGLRAGEQVRIVYGAGAAGARADRFAERRSRFAFAVDGDGDGTRELLPEAPEVDVRAGPPARLVATLPSTAQPGDELTLRLAFLDAEGSAGVDVEGEVTLEAAGAELPAKVSFARADEGLRAVRLVARGPGVVRVRAKGGGLEAESNPLFVAAQVQRILWGDLHGHSNLSDGTGTPEDYYRYARDVAGLDVAALTDHDHWGLPFLDRHPELWREIRDTTARFHAPGRFVTLLGFEWTSWLQGHRHVLYFEDDGALLSSLDEATDDPDELWAALRGRRVLTLAHHSAGGPVATNWSFAPDPELEPVTEIASVHGSSEAPDAPLPIYAAVAGNFVRDALARGYRLGFVGSGDSHDGHPGLAQLASGSGGGLAAILAPEATRDAVLAALRARRCYATNGPRIILQTSLAGRPQGSLVPPGRQRLRAQVVAPGILDRIDVIRGPAVVFSASAAPGDEGREAALDEPLEDLRPGEFVYLRAVQRDGGAAWSSPFFIDEATP